LQPTDKPTSLKRTEERIQFQRKASFFALAAAEELSEMEGDVPDDRASAMWASASKMLAQKGNTSETVNYGWATLRAVALHALSMQGLRETSEDAAVKLLSLMSEITPTTTKTESSLFFSRYESLEGDDESKVNDDSTVRSDYDTTSSYIGAGKSAASAARSYVRERAKDAIRGRQQNFFSSQNQNSNTLLAVAQSRWVDDDPIPPVLLPVAEFSEISSSIIAMRAVWSAIKFENCADAQQKLVTQISNLRKTNPTSSLLSKSPTELSSSLPIKITSVEIGGSESYAALERVKLRVEKKNMEDGMATFFNPYANKSKENEATLIPEGEERYLLVKFANCLSIPLEIPRCQLEFDVPDTVRIKAPAISFVIPGQTPDFAVQFPFILLNDQETSKVFAVKGLHVTCLARSFFLPLDGPAESDESAEGKTRQEEPNIPKSSALYPRRDYEEKNADSSGIKSPRLEVVAAQPNLLISFARSAKTPLREDTIIPAPIADGEVFTIPKLLLANDCGLGGNGKIEELRISAVGLPGFPEILLFDVNGAKENGAKENEGMYRSAKKGPTPLTLKVSCNGVNATNLNRQGISADASSISLQLSAAPDMGAHNKGCEVTIRFRYRGKPASSLLEVWRSRELTLHILRIKGPRVSSITFRPDLTWGSGYSQLCEKLSHQDKHTRYRSSRIDKSDLPKIGITDDEDFVLNRLGKDPGVHTCSDKVVVIVSVANETASAICLSRPEGTIGGFEGSPIETMKVTSGISAKIPMILHRVDRSAELCERLRELTTLRWESEEVGGKAAIEEIETSGSMVPVNRRVRSGILKIPEGCLKLIVDENPTFIPRICKSPCSIKIGVVGADGKDADVGIGKPVDLSTQLGIADWLPADILGKNNLALEFCCARKDGTESAKRDYIWCGQIKKSIMPTKEDSNSTHRSRIIFLNEGEFIVSACVTFRKNDIEDDVKEIWWADKAQVVRVNDMSLSQ
jgi:hypothetical protein